MKSFPNANSGWLRDFLGHIVSQEGIQVDPQKLEAASKWSRLSSVIEIRSFLSLAGYYHRFVKDFFKIATPLMRLTRKGVKFVWNDECEKSFQKLKECLTTMPMLALPYGNRGCMAYYDRSRVGLGCVLMQNRHVIAYPLRQLKKHEENYKIQ